MAPSTPATGRPPGATEQRVEAPRAAVAQPDLAGAVVDAGDGIDHERGPRVLREARERDSVGRAERERLGHGQRPVDELGLRGETRRDHTIPCDGPHAEQRFEPRDAPACDHDVHAPGR